METCNERRNYETRWLCASMYVAGFYFASLLRTSIWKIQLLAGFVNDVYVEIIFCIFGPKSCSFYNVSIRFVRPFDSLWIWFSFFKALKALKFWLWSLKVLENNTVESTIVYLFHKWFYYFKCDGWEHEKQLCNKKITCLSRQLYFGPLPLEKKSLNSETKSHWKSLN